ncbi:MAG: HAD-IIIA family hydrolase [Candidatus Omnitrophica bacterium]|nr:HAD-IIIA family hydrolase [Candidatus Omnitrophota bacterium]
MLNIGKSKNAKSKKLLKVVFLDRDGVINRDPIGDYIKTWEQFQLLPGVIQGLQKLTRADFEIIIVSNQAGIGDGVYPKHVLDDITRKMLVVFKKNRIQIRGVYYCLHGKTAGCKCRKPEVGLFQRASKNIYYHKTRTFFVGDKASDVLAGKRFGLKTAFLLTGHGKDDFSKLKSLKIKPDLISKNFKDAINRLCRK